MNRDLLKVIAGLNCCTGDDSENNCKMCPYDKGELDAQCLTDMKLDALTLLKEMDLKITKLEHELKYARGCW